MFDTHSHTLNSHDSKQSIEELCISAIEKGLKAITVTNHVDTFAYTEEHNSNVIYADIEDVKRAKAAFGDKLKILLGAEIGGYTRDIEQTKRLCSLADFDVILGSVHGFDLNREHIRFSRDVMDETPMDKIIARAEEYYNKLIATAEQCDIDILCHITYPMRYINGRYGRNLDVMMFEDKFNRIFEIIIERGIALEINTSNLGTAYDYTSPNLELVEKYKNMGGKLISLGSDAHTPQKVGNGFKLVKNNLKDMGFEKYYYFEKRNPIEVML